MTSTARSSALSSRTLSVAHLPFMLLLPSASYQVLYIAKAVSCFKISSKNLSLFTGDDQHSAAGGALQSRPGTDYFERSCQSQIPSGEETENLIIDSGTGTLGSGQTQTASQARRCTFGRLEYEKTTGYELIRWKNSYLGKV